MKAGKLRDVVTVEKQVSTKDEYSQAVVKWKKVDTTYANIRAVSGDESLVRDQLNGVVKYTVQVREAYTTKHRLITQDFRTLRIRASIPDYKNRYHILHCEQEL